MNLCENWYEYHIINVYARTQTTHAHTHKHTLTLTHSLTHSLNDVRFES
jgi:hypothetical protein